MSQQRFINFETNFLAAMRESLGNPKVPSGATPQGVLALWGKRLEAYRPEHLQAAAEWFLDLARWPESFREVLEWMDYRNFQPNNGLAIENKGHTQRSEIASQIIKAFHNHDDYDTRSAIIALADQFRKNTSNKKHADYRFRSPNKHMNTEDFIAEAVNEGKITWPLIAEQIEYEKPIGEANKKKLAEMYPNGRPAAGLRAQVYDLMHICAYGKLPDGSQPYTEGREDMIDDFS
jgi:hypothetical protein